MAFSSWPTIIVQMLVVLGTSRAFPVDNDVFYSWEEDFGGTPVFFEDNYNDRQLAPAEPDCDYSLVGLVASSSDIGDDDGGIFAVGVLTDDGSQLAAYDEDNEVGGAGASNAFDLGDDVSYAEVHARLVSWLLQMDQEQEREDAETMATSFLDELAA